MKNIILLGSVVLFIFVNCGEDISSDEVVYKNPCDIALDYINECIGAKVPDLKQCDEGVAIEIVNTPCNKISKVIFDK